MICARFQSEGMKLLDGEMENAEKALYEEHLRSCEDCKKEMKEIGMIIDWTKELKLREPEDEFWNAYWNGLYKRLERNFGFFLVIIGVIALVIYGIIRAVTSPEFLTFSGISLALILVGLLIVFISVARERYYERKNDPYRKVKR